MQIASDEERLRFLRDVFGTTANLTALQPIIIVEGMNEKDAKRTVSDHKLYRALHPGFDSVTVVAGGGKGQCKALLNVLDEALRGFSSQLNAVALLDRDTDVAQSNGQVHLLPVSMIENFLLDPDSIWDAIQSIVERTSLSTVDDVASALDTLLSGMEANEIERRVLETLGLSYFRPSKPIADIGSQLAAYVFNVQTKYSGARVSIAKKQALKKVEELRNQQRRREEFHGKAVLDKFYKEHLHATGLAKHIFTFEAARYARRRRAVVSYFDEFFAKLPNPSDVEGHGRSSQDDPQ